MGAIKNARHPFYNHCDEALDQIRHAGRYRTFTPLSRQAEHFPVYEEERQDVSGARDVVVWSTNDYLGMGVVPEVQEAAIEAVRAHGAGAGGTRNIAGTSPLHNQLEAELAALHGKEAGLLFISGYVSNQASLQTILTSMPGWICFPTGSTMPP